MTRRKKPARVDEVTTAELRANLPDLVDNVQHGERFVVTHFRKPVAALVSLADLDRLKHIDLTTAHPEEHHMQIISTWNESGGAGKSTAVWELAYQISQRTNPTTGRKHRVLMVDLDPQASLTRRTGVLDDPQSPAHQVTNSIVLAGMSGLPLPSPLPTVHVPEVHLLPSHEDLKHLELIFNNNEANITKLVSAMRAVRNYDFILIDTPPSSGGLTRAALACSDHLIVPVNSTLKALENLHKVAKLVSESRVHQQDYKDLHLDVAMFIVTGFHNNVRHDKEVLELLRTEYAAVAPTSSPITYRHALFNDAGFARKPVAMEYPTNPAAEELAQVADELLAVLTAKVGA